MRGEQPRERDGARPIGANRGKDVLVALGRDAVNIAIAVGMLVAIYWLVGHEFPGGTVGISALLGGLIALDAVATAYDCLTG